MIRANISSDIPSDNWWSRWVVQVDISSNNWWSRWVIQVIISSNISSNIPSNICLNHPPTPPNIRKDTHLNHPPAPPDIRGDIRGDILLNHPPAARYSILNCLPARRIQYFFVLEMHRGYIAFSSWKCTGDAVLFCLGKAPGIQCFFDLKNQKLPCSRYLFAALGEISNKVKAHQSDHLA